MCARIVPVTTLDPAQPELALTWHEVFLTASRHDMGDDQDAWSLESRRAREASPNWQRHYLAAIDSDGVVVGSAELALPLRDNPELALVHVAVLPDRRRQGIGSRLFDELLALITSNGRRSIVAETGVRAGSHDPGEGFLVRHGFAVAQTMQRNDLDLTTGDHDGTHDEKRWGGAAYVIETSTDDTLDEWLEDRAHLQFRMSSDAPVGELDFGEEEWDAERLRGQRDATRDSGRRAFESVARHVESGRLVAFTQLQVPVADPTVAYQQDTLVLTEHRGHGLGAALKTANVAALRAAFPQTRIVRTWNAVENGPMVAVNEALGFETTALLREWQRRLD